MMASRASPPVLRRRGQNNGEDECDVFPFNFHSPRQDNSSMGGDGTDGYDAKGHSTKHHGVNGRSHYHFRRVVAQATVFMLLLLSLTLLTPTPDRESADVWTVRRSLTLHDSRSAGEPRRLHLQPQWLIIAIKLPPLPISERLHDGRPPADEDLTIYNRSGKGAPRTIHESDDQRQYEESRYQLLEEMDVSPNGLDPYYQNLEDLDPKEPCRRNQMRSLRFQNCNTFHEQSLERPPSSEPSGLQLYNVTYRGKGSFRFTWHFHSVQGEDDFVLKVLRYRSDFDYQAMAEMNNEAVVMERLSGSPRIVDIYGNCGFSIAAENMEYELTKELVPGSEIDYSKYGYMKQSELDGLQVHDVQPQNSLTVQQKLVYAIVMSEAIADIHGFSGGVIFHGDIHPVQFLKNKAGLVKLNDFNNGQILKFDAPKGAYCEEYRCYGGTYRPPEELLCDDTYANEAVDVWPMGNNIYCLLTGLWPYYEYGNRQDRKVIKRIRKCETPTVDVRYRNRSVIEAGLVQIMEQTWECDYTKRMSIFDVVRQLHELRDRASRSGDTNM